MDNNPRASKMDPDAPNDNDLFEDRLRLSILKDTRQLCRQVIKDAMSG